MPMWSGLASRPAGRRPSNHVEPEGVYLTAQHYVGDLVYGANDGILTSFAVVSVCVAWLFLSRLCHLM